MGLSGEKYLPFSFASEKKTRDAEDLVGDLQDSIDREDYFDIGPTSAKLLKEILDILVEGYDV